MIMIIMIVVCANNNNKQLGVRNSTFLEAFQSSSTRCINHPTDIEASTIACMIAWHYLSSQSGSQSSSQPASQLQLPDLLVDNTLSVSIVLSCPEPFLSATPIRYTRMGGSRHHYWCEPLSMRNSTFCVPVVEPFQASTATLSRASLTVVIADEQ